MMRYSRVILYRFYSSSFRYPVRHKYGAVNVHNVKGKICNSGFRCLLKTPASVALRLSSYSPKNRVDDDKQMLEEFPDPKFTFQKVINEAYVLLQSPDLKPDISFEQIPCESTPHQFLWKVKMIVSWPERIIIEMVANKKTEAEKLAYLHVCKKYKELGVLDDKNLPVLPENLKIFKENDLKSAKVDLRNIYQIVWPRIGTRDAIPSYSSTQVQGFFGDCYWKSVLSIKYPYAICFEGLSKRQHVADSIAAAKALQWLFHIDFINKKKQPILYTKEDKKKMLQYHEAPYPIIIPPELQSGMEDCLKSFKEAEFQPHLLGNMFDENVCHTGKVSLLCDEFLECERDEDERTWSFPKLSENITLPEHDIITEKLWSEYTDQYLMERSLCMYNRHVEWQESVNPNAVKISMSRLALPISQKREDILKLIQNNQVVVLSGDTGCGKTTQVPQYILESFIKERKGAECNIIVTQPRRISAISVAEFVAAEHGEKVGETVGYQVRLNKILPSDKGAILFCSTGILLRKLCLNPHLLGVSHIIVDEVHERNVQIDFLLILLKRLLQINKSIKIVLMSATFNVKMFSEYFGNCPVIHVPGFMFPVKEFFLDEIHTLLDYETNLHVNPKLDFDVLVEVVDHIHTTRPPGAILCFLPGWNDIKAASKKLRESLENQSSYVICPVHSRLPHEQQRHIFTKPPDGVRKIILATNIAETSITVSDVVYVVDPGFHKGTYFSDEKGTVSLGTVWISKANVRQRRGRAGRVQPGECYHLFPRKFLNEMDDFPIPEMLRMPLEKVILDCKLYCPDVKAVDLLSESLQPPSQSNILHGVQELQILGILSEQETLTQLGKIIVNFTAHPRLSKALVVAVFLRCLDPVLTICSFLTLNRDPFINSLEDKFEIKKIKDLNGDIYSDHLALCKIFDRWNGHSDDEDAKSFCEENLLDHDSMIFVKRLKGLYADHLYEAGLIDEVNCFWKPDSKYNENSHDSNLIRSTLCSAFYPNIIKTVQGEITHGRLNKDTVIYSTMKRHKVQIPKESVLYKQYDLPDPWMVYFSALKSNAKCSMIIHDVSLVPGMCLLLFSGQHLKADNIKDGESNVVLKIDDFNKLSFLCRDSDAQLLLKWRKCLDDFFQLHVQVFMEHTSEDTANIWRFFDSEIIPTLKKLLCTPQTPFTSGKVFSLVGNKVIAEDWE